MKAFTLLKNKLGKNIVEVVLSCTILLFLWECIALFINNEIYIPTLGQVFKSLNNLILETGFFINIFMTIKRTIVSILISLFIAMLIGVSGYISRVIRNFFRPINMIIQSVPMMILVVLALIWFDKDNAPYIVGVLVVFPILYENILGALSSIDKTLLEMSNVYKLDLKDKIIKIYLPSIKFRLATIIVSTMSLGLKVVIAGEVYGQPDYGIGSMIQLEKVNFNTPGIFAWLIIVIIISGALEILQKLILRRTFIWKR
ncbi:ABC transporter permease [Romboutsia lituseburensis]|uniref:NitT/TauT family transport system permease protein n=1 Tax=Romboutsia lituseburensis DSM 797 TaxID=1121325 RepID=A0A1G9SR16_9FIRM|nr:ABC transporter permease subunit [Romboutsia lituseburensis]CEH33010.1 ABC transporter, permease protein [Romboutsia lituseburensis]SDM37872.1 NitT/TauT family transport system permease protein [Romboutsia lituseburensis DSM 797]